VIITRQSVLTGRIRNWDIDISPEQLDLWNAGGLIQNVMPDITAVEREFIKTGITPDEWSEQFPLGEPHEH